MIKNKVKEIIQYGLLGGVIELVITYVITIIISLCLNDGNYYSVVPELLNVFETEQSAVLFQAGLTFIMGFIIGCSRLIKRTAIHFVLTMIAVLPIAWVCRWIKRDLVGILLYVGGFIVVYIIIWLCFFLSQRNKLKEINKVIKDKK